MTEQTVEIEKEVLETTIEKTRPRRRFTPRVDIFETSDAVFMTVEMPGVGENAVELTLEKNILTIRGQIEDIVPDKYELTHREYRVGDYKRTFALSDDVNQDHIQASMKNGVLLLTLPKAEEVIARKITVRAE